MTVEEVKSFVNIVNSYNDLDYLISTIMCSAAPTLAREKVSSLLNFSNNNRNLQNTWKKYRKYIKEMLNVSFVEIKNNEKNTVVFFYSREYLVRILKDKRNMNFLTRFGYSEEMSIEKCISHLKTRFKNTCPHEIGIFLGYPVEDVECFINCPNEKCMMVGYWKVYNNVEEAKCIFNRYDEIKGNVIRMMVEGIKPMEIVQDYFGSFGEGVL